MSKKAQFIYCNTKGLLHQHRVMCLHTYQLSGLLLWYFVVASSVVLLCCSLSFVCSCFGRLRRLGVCSSQEISSEDNH